MISNTWRRAAGIALSFFLLLGNDQARADLLTYLSLGDSIGSGEQTFAGKSDGDRGYVSLFDAYLASQHGNVAPNVINLAVDGETSSSLFSGSGRVPPAAGYSDGDLARLNTHYTDPLPNQNQLLLATIASELGKGHTISNVTISLGSNDLFALALTPGFLQLPPAQQAAAVHAALATLGTNVGGLLTELQSLLPHARIDLVGSYNPFPAAPGSPFGTLAGPAIVGLNQELQGLASFFHVNYANTYDPFVGHEAAYTHITDPPAGSYNVHPNDAGYAAIAGALEAVPEPSAVALLALGTVGLIAAGRRRHATQF